MDAVLNMDLVEKTWAEVGYKVRPLGRKLFVRTLPIEEKIGSIYKPVKLTKFHGELPHMQLIRGVVLAAGPEAKVKIGEQICFTRLYFAWLKKMEDLTMFGWITEEQACGYCEGEQ